jgi:predicted small integral membrane protein
MLGKLKFQQIGITYLDERTFALQIFTAFVVDELPFLFWNQAEWQGRKDHIRLITVDILVKIAC